MNLFDPERPRINGLPLYLNSFTVIIGLRAMPLANGLIELSTFLPLAGESLAFAKRFRAEVPEVDSWLNRFTHDPEECLEALFDGETTRPNLRNARYVPELEIIEELEMLESL